MSRVLLLRHGESVGNAHTGGETLSDDEGDRLTENGLAQATLPERAWPGTERRGC
jgi:broad specificity phosphatase PhoE